MAIIPTPEQPDDAPEVTWISSDGLTFLAAYGHLHLGLFTALAVARHAADAGLEVTLATFGFDSSWVTVDDTSTRVRHTWGVERDGYLLWDVNDGELIDQSTDGAFPFTILEVTP